MDILDTHLVKIGAMADNKADAIGHVVDLLVEADKIDPRYRESMLGREKVANTFLGNGIAIPHGLPKDRELIKQTAIAVAQFPDGVEWAPGDKVHLVVGIAAKSDEHLQILSNLTGVLGEPEEAARLATTTNPADIVGRLTGMHASSDKTEKNTLDDFEAGFDIVIRSPHGLHARPATALIELAKRYQSSIRIRYKDKVADAKSLISLLNLGIGANDSVRVMAEGDDAEQALSVLKETIELGLDDDEEEDRAFISTIADSDEKINYEGSTKAGISSSPGFAIGPIFQFSHERIVVEVTAKDPAHELERLDHALNTAHRQLDELYQEVWKKSGPAKASIFRAHQEFLEDPEMINEAQAMIRDGHSAGYAWQQAFEDRANVLASMKDPLLSGRAVDLRDAGRRALRQLASSIEDSRQLPVVPCVLVADDLTPSDTAQLDPSLVLGLCTAAGGPTSHTSIIARSLDIPAVVGAGASVLDIPTGTSSLLDGSHGLLVVDPTEVDREFAEKSIYDLKLRRDMEQANCFKPAITTDGQRIEVVANISDLEDAAYAVDAGGEGVGLLRTEFLFVNRDAAPSESEQEDIYVGMIKAMNGLPIIIRTLDIGGDKEIPYLYMPAEDNPFLGERGIRFCFSHQDLFRSQLRAIFRASNYGPVRIMFPMVSMHSELMDAKSIAEEIRQEVGAEPVEIGIMIEVPSAVMMASELAREVDFFSIGTNDLTQYALAMDRLHPVLSKQADGLSPAVLRLIDQTVKAADEAGIWVGACGGIAGDPKGVTILTGLGVKELSVSIPSIAAVKAQVREQSLEYNRNIAKQALACTDAVSVRALA